MENTSDFKFVPSFGTRKIYPDNRIGLISNNNLTNELALEFLSINPKRIECFEVYPDNWSEMLKAGGESNKQKEPLQVANLQKEDKTGYIDKEGEDIKREALKGYKMYELRKRYPNIKETSKDRFITEILKQE